MKNNLLKMAVISSTLFIGASRLQAQDFTYQTNFSKSVISPFEKRVKTHLVYLKESYFSKLNTNHNLNFNFLVQVDNTIDTDGLSIVQTDGQLVVKVSPLVMASARLERLLTHEFFHLVHYQIKSNELAWVKEGLATYFEFLVHGQSHQASIDAAFQTSTTALEGEYPIGKSNPEQYGHNHLFFYFAINNCGGEQLFYSLTEGEGIGRNGIETALLNTYSSKEYCKSFKSLATQFTKARVVNSLSEYGRSKDLYILKASHSLPINTYISETLSNKSNAYLSKFIKALPSYLPVLLPKNAFLLAQRLHAIDSELYIVGVKRSFPAKVLDWKSLDKKNAAELILIYKN